MIRQHKIQNIPAKNKTTGFESSISNRSFNKSATIHIYVFFFFLQGVTIKSSNFQALKHEIFVFKNNCLEKASISNVMSRKIWKEVVSKNRQLVCVVFLSAFLSRKKNSAHWAINGRILLTS